VIGESAVKPRFRTVVFDVDSTVAALEGIDWLATQRGPEVAGECKVLTAQAMDGVIPLEAVYERRLAAIRPTPSDISALSQAYLDAVQPLADAVFAAMHRAGIDVHLLSGGLRDAILPLAESLHVPPRCVHAVSLEPDASGHLVRLHGDQPLATQSGKPRVLAALLAAATITRPIAMIGDGSTDAATRGVVDQFIAYTGVTRRDAVVAVADAEASDFSSLLPLVFHLPPDWSHG
jgi:HAD superfamily phosphoserine phosphatase-like hydrolase